MDPLGQALVFFGEGFDPSHPGKRDTTTRPSSGSCALKSDWRQFSTPPCAQTIPITSIGKEGTGMDTSLGADNSLQPPMETHAKVAYNGNFRSAAKSG